MASVPSLAQLRAASQLTDATSDDEEGDDSSSTGTGTGTGTSTGSTTTPSANKSEYKNNIGSKGYGSSSGSGNGSGNGRDVLPPTPNESLSSQAATSSAEQPSASSSTKKSSFWFRSSRSSTAKPPAPEPVKQHPTYSFEADDRYAPPNNNNTYYNEQYQQQQQHQHSDPHLKQSYQQMLQMTLELVDDIYLNLRPGDSVLTVYGPGTLLQKQSNDLDEHHDVVAGFLSTRGNTIKTKIQLAWGGVLYCPQSELIHKVLSAQEYEQAMDHLEEIRKLQVAIQCHEWDIPPQGDDEACVACLFHKPELYGSSSSSRRTSTATTTTSNNNKSRTSYWGRSSSTASTGSNKSSSSKRDRPAATSKTKRCDVCGNPVCSQHKIAMGGGEVEFFSMCVDCSHDLNQTEHNFHAHHPQLLQNLQRMNQYYTRMSLQLCFCVPNLPELCHQLTHKQKRDGAISLGNSALGFVGAALGVAGAAAMLTPAGPAILLAAVATSATSGTFQGMHASYNKFLSNKTAHQLADRCLGWHGLCLGILNALEKLRQDLIVKDQDFVEEQNNSSGSPMKGGGGARPSSHVGGGGNSQHSLEIWNALAVGSFSTTRSAMTGVSVTSAFGASYSQAINTSLQGIPVVGAAFAVGCMAMDANNMASSFTMLNTPAKKAVALQGVEQSFVRHVVTTISPSVDMIIQGVDDLHERMAEQRQEEERRLIEEELQGLGGSGGGGDYYGDDDDLERELAGL